MCVCVCARARARARARVCVCMTSAQGCVFFLGCNSHKNQNDLNLFFLVTKRPSKRQSVSSGRICSFVLAATPRHTLQIKLAILLTHHMVA